MTTKTKDKILKQALEVLGEFEWGTVPPKVTKLMAEIQDALALPKQEQPLTIPKSKPTSLRQLVQLMSERFLIGQTGDGHEIVYVPPWVWSSAKKCVLDLDTNWQALTTPKPQQEKHSAL